MTTAILRLFGLIWYICLFAIILPFAMIMVSTTLDREIAVYLPLSLHWSTPLLTAGSLLIIAALALYILSVVTLHRHGKAYPWSIGTHVAYNPQTLVTSGPYAYIRHPMATSYLVALAGLACFVPSLVMLVWLIPLSFGLFYEVLEYTEEIQLKRWFGQAYLDYHHRTPSLIPRWGFWRSLSPTSLKTSSPTPSLISPASTSISTASSRPTPTTQPKAKPKTPKSTKNTSPTKRST